MPNKPRGIAPKSIDDLIRYNSQRNPNPRTIGRFGAPQFGVSDPTLNAIRSRAIARDRALGVLRESSDIVDQAELRHLRRTVADLREENDKLLKDNEYLTQIAATSVDINDRLNRQLRQAKDIIAIHERAHQLRMFSHFNDLPLDTTTRKAP